MLIIDIIRKRNIEGDIKEAKVHSLGILNNGGYIYNSNYL